MFPYKVEENKYNRILYILRIKIFLRIFKKGGIHMIQIKTIYGSIRITKDNNDQIIICVKDILKCLNLTESQIKRIIKNLQTDCKINCETVLICINEKKDIYITKDYISSWLSNIKITRFMSTDIYEKISYFKNNKDKLFLFDEANSQQEIDKLKNEITEIKQMLFSSKNALEEVLKNNTISYEQQKLIIGFAKEKIINLLGNPESVLYKNESGKYFNKLWCQFRKYFEIVSYRDLNPNQIELARNFIFEWYYQS